MQLRKLAVICNVCFWLTIIFQYWASAREIHEDVLNTIIILGLLSVLVNMAWVLKLVMNNPLNQKMPQAETDNKTKATNHISMQFFKWFNILSFVAQLVFLYLKYL